MAATELLESCVCPHCWVRFAPEDVLWVAAHAELAGDLRLGPDQPMRFLPSRFDLQGNAIDARGFACTSLACPRCHLHVPRALLELPPYFISMLGTPACGKSVYLTSLVWQLRRELPKRLGISFQDVDPQANRTLNDWERDLFLARGSNRLVPMASLIPKTQALGEHYDYVSDGEQVIQYPKPYLFALQRRADSGSPGSRDSFRDCVLCLYDNAGEHFQAGADSTAAPVTQHLARSNVLFYLFDPLQDPRFRQRLEARGASPTVSPVTARQEIVLTEAAARIRRLRGLSQKAKIDRPLVVIVTKADAWGEAVQLPTADPWRLAGNDVTAYLNLIDRLSAQLRELLTAHCPELVSTAEDLSGSVTYIPASALGTAPQADPATGKAAIDPARVKPFWVTAPFLYTLFKYPIDTSRPAAGAGA